MYCSKCGANVADGIAFCSACGQPMVGVSVGHAAVATPGAPAPPVYAPAAPQYGGVGAVPALYAGFWLRVVAAILDGLILGIPIIIVIAFLAVAMGIGGAFHNVKPGDPPSAVLSILGGSFLFAVFAVFIVGGWLYFALLESSGLQGTLGKKALGLYVADLQGNRITFGRASGRFLGGRFLGHVPGPGGLYFMIDCICAGLTERKQAIHDMIAGTLVLRKA